MQKVQSAALLVTFLLFSATAYIIPSVPEHRQFNGYCCGCASFEMLYHYATKIDLDQRAIASVMRTSNYTGTLSYDLVRAAHFSQISSTPQQLAYLFPTFAPKSGWSNGALRQTQYGLAGFTKRSQECWYKELAEVIVKHKQPVAVLQDLTPGHGGHFRVVVGYDEDAKTFFLHDPWERAPFVRLSNQTVEQFCLLWQHKEPNEELEVINESGEKFVSQKANYYFDPYFAFMLAPWSVSVAYKNLETPSVNGDLLEVEANITYTCYGAFCSDPKAPAAYSAEAQLVLPPTMNITASSPQQMSVKLGTMAPGDTKTLKWQVFAAGFDYEQEGIFMMPRVEQPITVRAFGLIKGSVPETQYRPPSTYNPGYEYNDVLGAEGFVNY